ncbi:DUF2303 family protein [Moraxella canis]|uniref:DUF2303 domain-containing protein n=1 Tax=Moraxella canis TaxID=90239 RepID=A0A1S9ZKB8_9GAMM|nr:DUF2303 family protein [Moraxella canis]OOR83894.1 hypothetical protein B0180_05485 [Moraxella canis]
MSNLKEMSDAAVGATLADPVAYPIEGINAISHNEHTKITDLERYQDGRNRARGKFVTYHIAQFAHFVSNYGVPAHTVVFVNDVEMDALALLDFGHDDYVMGKCEYHATCQARKTPVFETLSKNNRNRISHRNFIDLLIDWSPVLTAYNANNEIIRITDAITALRSIDIKATATANSEVQDMSESRSKFEQVSAKTANNNTPVRFVVEDACYESLPLRQIALRLAIDTQGGEPEFKLIIDGLELLERERTRVFADLIQDAIGEEYDVLIGEFSP